MEPGQAPPLVTDILEDWVRAPLAQRDLEVRVNALAARHQHDNQPYLDDLDHLVFRGRRAQPSPSQVALLRPLLRGYEEPVARTLLSSALGHDTCPEGDRRNLLDLHMGRLRRKVEPLGLTIRTVWGAGYVLECLDTTAPWGAAWAPERAAACEASR